MKKMCKNRPFNSVFAVMFVVILAAGSVFSVSAAESEVKTEAINLTEDKFTYTVKDGAAAITGYIGTDETVVIPPYLNSFPVAAIDREAFYRNEYVTDIEIPYGVTSIGSGAFYGCGNLRSVSLPETVTAIGYNAFYACSSLTEITVPHGVQIIEPWTFGECVNLDSISLPESVSQIGYGAFDNTAFFNNEDNWENGMLYLNGHLIAVDKDIEKAVLKSDTKSISNAVFAECKNLTDIEITDNINSIGIATFDGCERLAKAYIPDTVTFIGDNAFSRCPDLVIHGKAGSYAEKYANDNNIKFVAENSVAIGDINNDGALTIVDVSLLQNKLITEEESAYFYKSVNVDYDFNGDGEFDVLDITYLQMVLAEII